MGKMPKILEKHFASIREELSLITELSDRLEAVKKEVARTSDIIKDNHLLDMKLPSTMTQNVMHEFSIGFKKSELEGVLEDYQKAVSNLIFVKDEDEEDE